MKGIFIKNKNAKAVGRTFLLGGLVIITVFFVQMIIDSFKHLSASDIAFLLLGLVMLVTGVLTLNFNRGAFLTVDDDILTARCGWGKKISISLSDIDYVASNGTILSIFQKFGKRYMISGLENSSDICRYITENRQSKQ